MSTAIVPVEQSDVVVRMRQMLSMLDSGSTHDDIASAIDTVQLFGRLAKEFKAALDGAMLEWMEANHRDITIGDVRYYAGVSKVTTCTDTAATLDALFEWAQGDMKKVTDAFASSPYKHGFCRDILEPDKYAAMFITEERGKVSEGKPKKTVQQINQRFIT